MDNNQMQVLRFFLLLNALPIEKKVEVIADPLCCDAIMEAVVNGQVHVSESVVYNLYTYHSYLFTAAMVSQEVTNAMDVTFNGDEWASKYHRPSLQNIAKTRRAELLGGRPS